MLHTAAAAPGAVLSSPASRACRRWSGGGEPGGSLCMPRGSHLLSSLCCWGQEWQSPFEWFPRQDAAFFFFFNDTHVAVIQSHVWSPFWEERGQSSEIESFTQPLLCLAELFLYPAEVGKPGWQYVPRNAAGLLPPDPKPPTAWLQCNWSLHTLHPARAGCQGGQV